MSFFEVWKMSVSRCEWDREVKNLGIRYNKTQAPSYVFRCQKDKKTWWICLGSVESLTLYRARDLADRMARLVRDRRDPRTCLEGPKTYTTKTLGDFLAEYLDYSKEYNSAKTYRENKQRALYLKPLFKRPLDSLTTRDMRELHKSVGQRGKPTANKVLEQMRHMINMAIEWGDLPTEHFNPAKKFKKYPTFPDSNFVEDTQMPKLLEVMNSHPNRLAVLAIKFGLITGIRLNQLQALKWSDVNTEAAKLYLPGKRNKNGENHILPLTQVHLDLLSQIRKNDDNPYIFPGRTKGARMWHLDRDWREIRRKAGLEHIKFHSGTRRTLGSWLIQQTGSLALVGQVLNQTNQHVTKIYSIYQTDHVKQELEIYTERLKKIGL